MTPFPTMERAKIIAKYLNFMHDEGDHNLVLEWALEMHCAHQIKKYLPWFLEAWNILKNQDRYEYNDLDNHAEVIDTADKKVLTITTQNRNYIFIYTHEVIAKQYEKIILHIRRYWDDFNFEDTYSMEDDTKIREGGIKEAIKKADWFQENYSDNYDDADSWMMGRPNLQWYKDKKFDLGFKPEHHFTKYCSYADIRDDGYIATYKEGWLERRPKVEGALAHFYDIKWALFEINSLLTCLQEDKRREEK
jgi:hypothetical protein